MDSRILQNVLKRFKECDSVLFSILGILFISYFYILVSNKYTIKFKSKFEFIEFECNSRPVQQNCIWFAFCVVNSSTHRWHHNQMSMYSFPFKIMADNKRTLSWKIKFSTALWNLCMQSLWWFLWLLSKGKNKAFFLWERIGLISHVRWR